MPVATAYPPSSGSRAVELDPDGMVGVGPWVDEHLGTASQLLLRRVELELGALSREQLQSYAMAIWRGWLTERTVVHESLSGMGVDLQVELPQGFSPAEVVAAEAEDDDDYEDEEDD